MYPDNRLLTVKVAVFPETERVTSPQGPPELQGRLDGLFVPSKYQLCEPAQALLTLAVRHNIKASANHRLFFIRLFPI
jgi:hypothetical protein